MGSSKDFKNLSERSFMRNLNETITSFKGYTPPKGTKAPVEKKSVVKPSISKDKKTKSYTEEEFQAKLNKELKTNVKPTKEVDPFDEMIKRVGRAEMLLKKGDMSQEEFNTFKANELKKFK